MNTRLILKGVLLYGTLFSFILYASSLDSLDNSTFTIATLIIAGLIYLCYKILNEQDLEVLSFSKDDKEDPFI